MIDISHAGHVRTDSLNYVVSFEHHKYIIQESNSYDNKLIFVSDFWYLN